MGSTRVAWWSGLLLAAVSFVFTGCGGDEFPERAKVTGYRDDVDVGTTRRLFDLGLVPGIEVEMVRRAPLRDPVIYRVGDYEIALRKAQSDVIYVKTS